MGLDDYFDDFEKKMMRIEQRPVSRVSTRPAERSGLDRYFDDREHEAMRAEDEHFRDKRK